MFVRSMSAFFSGTNPYVAEPRNHQSDDLGKGAGAGAGAGAGGLLSRDLPPIPDEVTGKFVFKSWGGATGEVVHLSKFYGNLLKYSVGHAAEFA